MSVASSFASLPMRELIANPFKAACESQILLADEFIKYVDLLAFNDDGTTRILEFKLDQTVTDGTTGKVSVMPIQVRAPLIGLVSIPSLLIDSINVEFTMEVKTSDTTTTSSSREASLGVSGSIWGFSVAFKASCKSSEERTRSSDQSATYKVVVNGSQQPPAEGMSKLMDIIASCITPIQGGAQTATA